MLQPPLDEMDFDEYFKQAVEVVTQYDRASASLIQRRLGIGDARAARVIDQLEAAGVVGPAEGASPRPVLIKSVKELFGENWESFKQKEYKEVENWQPDPPKNYKVPSGVKLSQAKDVEWGTQFGEIYDNPDFKDTKVEFPHTFWG